MLREKLDSTGGAVVFASAAALTLGVATVPVYEIYKCGEDPYWLDGLDLLSATGLRAAVIPHYDNAEGGTHDTRFCYLGERRLAEMEQWLPDEAFVLGVDEHTGVIFDLDAGSVEIIGRGGLTVRAEGRSTSYAAGTTVAIADLASAAASLAEGAEPGAAPGGAVGAGKAAGGTVGGPIVPAERSTSPLVDLVRERESTFTAALRARDVDTAVRSVLDLEHDVTEWAADIPGGDELDRAHASLRTLIVELAELSATGARDPREVVGPFVEAMLELRAGARADRRFGDADSIRDRLAELGVEVRDGPEGSEWLLVGAPDPRHRRRPPPTEQAAGPGNFPSPPRSSPHRPAA